MNFSSYMIITFSDLSEYRWLFCVSVWGQFDLDWWVKELVIKFRVLMTNFSESFLVTHTWSLWNSDFWVMLVNLWLRWLRYGQTTLNQCQFNVSIGLIRWKENIDKLPHHFDVLFRCSFDGRKIDVLSTYFVWRNFIERNINVVSMYFFQPDFDGWKINAVSVYFLVYFPSWHSDIVTTLSQRRGWRCDKVVARSKMRVVAMSVSDV